MSSNTGEQGSVGDIMCALADETKDVGIIMRNRKSLGLPRVRKSKNTEYRRTLLKFSIPSVLDFVRENETESQIQKPFSAKSLPIGRMLSNPWVVGIATGLIVAAISSVYW